MCVGGAGGGITGTVRMNGGICWSDITLPNEYRLVPETKSKHNFNYTFDVDSQEKSNILRFSHLMSYCHTLVYIKKHHCYGSIISHTWCSFSMIF